MSMLEAVDKVDSASLTDDEIANPTGWILLGFIMDPRTGLGRYRDYRISNYQLMLDMIDHCRTMTDEDILRLPGRPGTGRQIHGRPTHVHRHAQGQLHGTRQRRGA